MKKRTTLEIILIITNIVTAIIAIIMTLKAFERKIINRIVPDVELGQLEDEDVVELGKAFDCLKGNTGYGKEE